MDTKNIGEFFYSFVLFVPFVVNNFLAINKYNVIYSLIMRKYLLVVGLVFIALPLFAQRGDLDEETQPIGLEHFNIKDIAINGRLDSFNLIDLNNDGVKEIIYIQTEPLSLEILSYDKSISEYRLKQTIKIPAGAMIICIGDYLPADGK